MYSTLAGVPELKSGESESAFLARLRKMTDPQDIADAETRYSGQLHSAAQAIYDAKQRNEKETVRNLLKVWMLYRNRYAAAGRNALKLSVFDRWLNNTNRWLLAPIGQAANIVIKPLKQVIAATGDAAEGAGKTLSILPLLAVGALVLVGIGLSKGTLSASVRR